MLGGVRVALPGHGLNNVWGYAGVVSLAAIVISRRGRPTHIGCGAGFAPVVDGEARWQFEYRYLSSLLWAAGRDGGRTPVAGDLAGANC